MSGFSTYLAQSVITKTLITPTFPITATLYLALFTADPTDGNVTIGEVAGVWYARQTTGGWTAPGAGASTSNSNLITYPAVTGSAISVSHWGVYDALSGGNLLYSDSVGSVKAFAIGDVPVIAANALVISFE